MDKKFQVFISSTYDDLEEEREAIIKAILDVGHIPIGMEMFSAGDEEQWKVIARTIDDADYYVVIVKHYYGSTIKSENGSVISYTEKEYDYAVSQKIPVMGFVIDPSVLIEKKYAKANPKLEAFKGKVKTRMINYWKSKDELYGKFVVAFNKAQLDYPRLGWVKANDFDQREITEELVRLSKENSHLRNEISSHTKAEFADIPSIVEVMKKKEYEIYYTDKNGIKKVYKESLMRLFERISFTVLYYNKFTDLQKTIKDDLKKSIGDNEAEIGVGVYLLLCDLIILDLIERNDYEKDAFTADTVFWLTPKGKKLLSELRFFGKYLD